MLRQVRHPGASRGSTDHGQPHTFLGVHGHADRLNIDSEFVYIILSKSSILLCLSDSELSVSIIWWMHKAFPQRSLKFCQIAIKYQVLLWIRFSADWEARKRGQVISIYTLITAYRAADTLHKSFQLTFTRNGKITVFSNETSNHQQLLSDNL